MSQKVKKNYSELLQLRKFDHSAPIQKDKIYFKIDNNVIGTAGNFITFSGLPKAGKSTFISAIIASAITRQPVFNFSIDLFLDHKSKIALFDTEQGVFDFQRTTARIRHLAKSDYIDQHFDSFLLREDNSTDILYLINTYLNENPNCGIIIIDGILDCIDNMNDEGASKRLIRTLKRWAVKHDILIITVLHLGKKDLSSIGHIGSASDRYAQSTLLVEKTKQGTYTCSAKYLRSAKDFNTIELFFNEEHKHYSTTQI